MIEGFDRKGGGEGDFVAAFVDHNAHAQIYR